jgi:propanol-preferring alcohol dehydrogenase
MLLESIGRMATDEAPLILADRAMPVPASDEVRLRVHACAVCHTELDQIEGRVPTTTPRVLGHQAVGTVDAVGDGVDRARIGECVGVGWIASACGECRWCERGEENLCPEFQATGRDCDGGYAEFMTIPAAFAVPMPEGLDAVHAAPLLCAGAIGYRSLKLAAVENGQVLGLTGFGASNHLGNL